METLIEIIKELRAEKAELKMLLEKEQARAEESTKNMLYWYEKYNALITTKNGN